MSGFNLERDRAQTIPSSVATSARMWNLAACYVHNILTKVATTETRQCRSAKLEVRGVVAAFDEGVGIRFAKLCGADHDVLENKVFDDTCLDAVAINQTLDVWRGRHPPVAESDPIDAPAAFGVLAALLDLHTES